MIISVIQENSCSKSSRVDVLISSKQPHTEAPHRSSDGNPSTFENNTSSQSSRADSDSSHSLNKTSAHSSDDDGS